MDMDMYQDVFTSGYGHPKPLPLVQPQARKKEFVLSVVIQLPAATQTHLISDTTGAHGQQQPLPPAQKPVQKQEFALMILRTPRLTLQQHSDMNGVNGYQPPPAQNLVQKQEFAPMTLRILKYTLYRLDMTIILKQAFATDAKTYTIISAIPVPEEE